MAPTSERTLHIGVDGTCWQNMRGYGRHARALLGTLIKIDTANRYTVFVDSPSEMLTLPAGAEVRRVAAARVANVAAAADSRRSLADLTRMSRALSGSGADILIFPTAYTYVPVVTRARKIVVIHDVIVETYPTLTVPRPLARWLWNLKIGLARAQADAIVTVSEHSRRGLIERFKLPADRLFVVGEASDPVFRVLETPEPTPPLRALGLPGSGRTVVYVGGFGPHKNLGTLIDVFARVAAEPRFEDVRLVMVGDYRHEAFHTEFNILREQVRRHGLANRVVFTGFLDDEDLVVLLNLATVLVLPSLLEGFGLPAIEAAACGCPVIATTASALPDVLGAGALYVDPCAPDELHARLVDVLESESVRAALRQAGLAAAARLTWEAAANDMLDVVRHVAAR
jgi:glycosyltransferase involved in cell wall biosynthesis